MRIRELFRKGQVWTIPNILTLFRALLIPFIIWAYLGLDNLPLTIILLALSAFTDVIDGKIARQFNMVSDLGKALDPTADKLTQVSIVLCLAFRYKLMWILLGLCVLRETCMFIFGCITMKKTHKVYSAKWFGKLSTVMLYGTGLALLVFRKMPKTVSTVLIILCMVCVVFSMIMYIRFHLSLWKQAEERPADAVS